MFESKQIGAGWAFYKAYATSVHYQMDELKDVNNDLKHNLINIAKAVILCIPTITANAQMKDEFYARLGLA